MNRKLANQENKRLASPANGGPFSPYDFHEIQPVRFGGDPVAPANKELILNVEHRQVTTWWNKLQRWAQGGGD